MEDEVLDMMSDAELDAQDKEHEQDEDPIIEYQDESMAELVAQHGGMEGNA
jgi:hypothetical protein